MATVRAGLAALRFGHFRGSRWRKLPALFNGFCFTFPSRNLGGRVPASAHAGLTATMSAFESIAASKVHGDRPTRRTVHSIATSRQGKRTIIEPKPNKEGGCLRATTCRLSLLNKGYRYPNGACVSAASKTESLPKLRDKFPR
jgi:hypothetical protein